MGYKRLTRDDKTVIDFVDFGRGFPILLIPGAGDGLRRVSKFPFAYILEKMYRRYGYNHRLIIMSRREPIPYGFSVQDFAHDYVWAMQKIGISRFHVETNSAGGPIGQWIAINYPNKVRSLVLGETMAHVDEELQEILLNWINLIKEHKWYEFHKDTIIKTYTPIKARKYLKLMPLIRFMRNPRDPSRIIRVLEGLLNVDNRPYLGKLVCPTLVIGGDMDQITRPELQEEMANSIPNSKRVILHETGHGANQEAEDEHQKRVLSFYKEVGH